MLPHSTPAAGFEAERDVAHVMTVDAHGMLPFVDPRTGVTLKAVPGYLVADDGTRYPIIDGIPRFVASEGYASGFGLQWSIHSTTQLDSRTGTTISRARLERCLGTSVGDLRAKRVLEVGCGAGRFTELLVAAGALVHAMDLSSAVEVNRANIGPEPKYRVAQADMLAVPFAEESFDWVIALGVLQHTPSPEASIRALWTRVRPGGMLVIDHYRLSWSRVTKLDTLLRTVLKRLPPAVSQRITDRLVRAFFPLHWAVRDVTVRGVPLLQMLLSRFSPVYFYYRSYPELSREQHYEWSRLDTFDHLNDRYKRMRTTRQIRRTLAALGALDICVGRGGNGVEARCRKPSAPEPREVAYAGGAETGSGRSATNR